MEILMYFILRTIFQIIFFPLAIMPYRWQWGISKFFARVALAFYKKRTRISFINLDLCFPELSSTEKVDIVINSYANIVMYVFDVANALFIYDIKKKDIEFEFEVPEEENWVDNCQVCMSIHSGSLIYDLYLTEFVKSGSSFQCIVREALLAHLCKILGLNLVIHFYKKINVVDFLVSIKNHSGAFIAYDQWVGGSMSMGGEVFGRRTGVMKSVPIFLKRIADKPIYYIIHTRTDKKYGKFKVYKRYVDKSSTSEEISEQTQKMLEKLVSENKNDWWWFHDRWKESPEGKHDPKKYPNEVSIY